MAGGPPCEQDNPWFALILFEILSIALCFLAWLIWLAFFKGQ